MAKQCVYFNRNTMTELLLEGSYLAEGLYTLTEIVYTPTGQREAELAWLRPYEECMDIVNSYPR